MVNAATQAVTQLPPIAFHSYPIDISLRIHREDARYGVDILAVGRSQRVPIEISIDDLVMLNRQLQQQMREVVSDDIERDRLTPEELEAQLRSLAEVGHYAFRQVFGHPAALEAIRQLMGLGGRISIQVISEDFFLPWELMYPASLDEKLSYGHFWGIRHTVSRVISQRARPGAFVPPEIPAGNRPKLGLLTYSGLPSVSEREIPFFENLDGDGKIVLFKLRPLDPQHRHKEFRAFKTFWNESLDLAHLACHAFYDDQSPNKSSILLSDDFAISLMDMEVYGIDISGHPLIIMNACETGNLNPLYTSHFAAAFLRYGARGVVATECAVPDNFAADFAEQLYTRLLAGEPLGESLLATRRYFLEEHNNPSGLLYSMYAPPSIRLVREGD